MAQKSESTEQLDTVQERILMGLLSLGKKKPKQCFHYAAISDEVRDQTKGEVVLTLRDLHVSKRPLLENGLIEDRGIGFVVTERGREVYHKVSTARPANQKEIRPTQH